MRKYKQGVYHIKNTEKYIGSQTSNEMTAIYRSSWEKIAFIYLDHNPNILKWGSECVVVPYKYRLDTTPKVRKYYIDIFFMDKFGKHLIEIKPKNQTDFNKIKRSKNKKNIIEYIKNVDKWNYAQVFAKENDMMFKIWTEEHINELKRQISIYKNFN